MLMAHSVEGRFPFLDRRVAALAESLPPGLQAARARREARPQAGSRRPDARGRSANGPKQPYRAPDALSFAADEAQEWIAEVASPAAVADAGCFEPAAVAQLLAKCASRAAAGQFSNADNMGVVGVLSTQLVHHHFIRERYRATAPAFIRTLIDHASEEVGTP